MSAKKVRLSQVIAVEKQLKQKLNTEGAELHKANQKADLFTGLTRTYEKLNDSDESLPPESKKVQMMAEESVEKWGELWAEYVGVVLTKEKGNVEASGTLSVIPDFVFPVSFLVWIEKQLHDHRTFVTNLPTLDPGRDWKKNDHTGLFETDTIKTARTKKTPKVITKAAATEHHPAQAELIYEDNLAGYWNHVGLSGAVSPSRKKELLDRVDKLIKEVKEAREEANSAKVTSYEEVGKKLVEYLIK